MEDKAAANAEVLANDSDGDLEPEIGLNPNLATGNEVIEIESDKATGSQDLSLPGPSSQAAPIVAIESSNPQGVSNDSQIFLKGRPPIPALLGAKFHYSILLDEADVEQDALYQVYHPNLPLMNRMYLRKPFPISDRTCPTCKRPQPCRMICSACKVPRFFYCFPFGRCYDLEPLTHDWQCKYCRHDTDGGPEPLKGRPEEEELFINRIRSRKNLEVYRRRIPRVIENRRRVDKSVACSRCHISAAELYRPCFLCNEKIIKNYCIREECFNPERHDSRMNYSWFCSDCRRKNSVSQKDVENYCFHCRQLMPIKEECSNCNKNYTFTCQYPPKCITIMFPDYVGKYKWNHCKTCLMAMFIKPILPRKLFAGVPKNEIKSVAIQAMNPPLGRIGSDDDDSDEDSDDDLVIL